MGRVYATDRLSVIYAEEEDAYAVQPPTDFEGVYKVNAALVEFYEPGDEEPFEWFEWRFEDSRVEGSDGYVLPGDQYEGCECEIIFAYKPDWGLPYEPVREEEQDLEPSEGFEDEFTDLDIELDPDDIDTLDYLQIDIHDPETDRYVAGDVYTLNDSRDREDDDELIFARNSYTYPSDYAGYTAEITYLRDPSG